MLWDILKIHFRTKYIFVFFFVIFIPFAELRFEVNLTILIPYLGQFQLTRQLSKLPVSIHLVAISGFPIGKFLILNNIISIVTVNFFYFIGKSASLILKSGTFLMADLIFLNFFLFSAYLFGNLISNSDILTFKKKIIQIITTSFAFGTLISVLGFILLATNYYGKNIASFSLLIFSGFSWYLYTISLNQIKYLSFIECKHD